MLTYDEMTSRPPRGIRVACQNPGASRWLETAVLDDCRVERFLGTNRTDGCAALLSTRVLAPLLGNVHRLALLATSDRTCRRFADRLIGSFEEHLVRDEAWPDSFHRYVGVRPLRGSDRSSAQMPRAVGPAVLTPAKR
jgi:hypothetical protein